MTLYDAKINTLDGSPADLSEFAGKALLVVNVASKCGLTPQYEGLQKLHEQYAGRGFEVLGFPCNDFGAQEPGSEAEIKTFCDTNYKVSFPLFIILPLAHTLWSSKQRARALITAAVPFRCWHCRGT